MEYAIGFRDHRAATFFVFLYIVNGRNFSVNGFFRMTDGAKCGIVELSEYAKGAMINGTQTLV